jgi:superfamily II DNA or RNA helicase
MSIIISMSNSGAKLINADQQAVSVVSDALSYDDEGAKFTAAYKMGQWNGKKTFLQFPGLLFHAGFVPLVRQALAEAGYAITINDTRERVEITADDIAIEGFEPYDFQLEAVSVLEREVRGIVQAATGAGKCLGRDTPVLMFNGAVKSVQGIVAGDLLMGPDSTPRRVLSTTSGIGKLYRVVPTKGESYIVNDAHILSLKQTTIHGRPKGTIVNVNIEDYLAKGPDFKHTHKGWRTGVDFEPGASLMIDPYFLGVWLGDGRGSSHSPVVEITTGDREIASECYSIAERHDLNVRNEYNSAQSRVLRLVGPHGGPRTSLRERNPLAHALNEYGLFHNKHIPLDYLRGTREERLELLAGLIDTDGSYDSHCFYLTLKNERLIDDAIFLARSLGLAAYKSRVKKTCSNNGKTGDYFTTAISGDLSQVPTRLPRKQAKPRAQKKDHLVTGIKVEDAGVGEYFGFELDGDKLFLLGDFTVTHNTEIAIMATKRFGLPTLFLTHKLDLVRQTRNRFHQRLGRPVGMISEGEWLPADITVATIQTILSNWTKIWEIRGLDRSSKPAVGEARGPTESEAAKYAKKTLKWKRVDSARMIEDRAAKVDAYLRSVRFLIVDEAHRSSGATFFKIINACINAYWRLSLTATPLMKGNREDDLKLIASSGNVIYRVTNGQLIARGILAEPHFSFVEVPGFIMPDGKKPYRHEYPAVYREGIVKNETRNSLVVEEALNLVKEGRQTVVLVKHIEHGKTLERLFAAAGAKALWLSGSDDGDERERGLNKLRSGEINILIASTILDEGLDCDVISAIVLAGGEKSKISLFQRVGRSVRAKKGDILERLGNTAKVVDFIDTGDPRLMKHSATRYKSVKSEDGWVIDPAPDGGPFRMYRSRPLILAAE